MTDYPADRTEDYRDFFAEYRRMRDSRGDEQLLVTLRMHVVEEDDTILSWDYTLDMDTLERFASCEMPKESFSKPFDESFENLSPDRVERFKGHTAFFHAGTSPKGEEATLVLLTFAKEKGDEVAFQPMMLVRHDALKEFAARGLEYERDLGITKRWRPLVQVVALGESEGTGVVETLESALDEGPAVERLQMQSDRSVLEVLWPHPFRQPLAPGDQFTVRKDTEGHYGYGRISIGIDRQLWQRDRLGETHLVALWNERSCEPFLGMPVRLGSPYEHNGRPREILAVPEGGPRDPGPPPKAQYLVIEQGRSRHGTVKAIFEDAAAAVAEFHRQEEMHQTRDYDLSRYYLPGGFRHGI